jgi:hypothetical protein
LRPPPSRHYLYYVPWEKSSSTRLNKFCDSNWIHCNHKFSISIYNHIICTLQSC